MEKEKRMPWELPNTEQAREKAKLFREKAKLSKEETDMWQAKNEYPSGLRVELALWKIQGVPGLLVGAILDDVFPGVSKDFAIKVAEEMKCMSEETEQKNMKLQPQRYEWVRKWAESKGKGTDTFVMSDKLKKAIELAKGEGLITELEETKSGQRYKWNESTELCAYFIGVVWCDDDYVLDGPSPRWSVTGERMRGAKYINRLFGLELNAARNNFKSKGRGIPENHQKIDKILKKVEAAC